MVWEVLDISKYQSDLNYNTIAHVINGVIMRAGYRAYGSTGTLVKDSMLETHYNGFANKTKIGYYWFSQATNDSEAIEEANYCHSLISTKQNDFPVYFYSDFANTNHTGRADGLTKAERTHLCLLWCQKMTSLGYRVGIYASDNWYFNYLNLDDIYDAGYSLWVTRESTYPPQYVSAYDMWKYTDEGTISGAPGSVGLTHCYKDLADWDKSSTKIDINTLEVTVDDEGLTYYGDILCPKVNVDGLTEGLDYTVSYHNNINAGTGYAIVTGIGNYVNQTTKTFTIGKQDIATHSREILSNPEVYVYTGSAITPSCEIPGLVKNRDYTLEFTNNTSIGTANIKATGIGNYTGTLLSTFIINAGEYHEVDISDYDFTIDIEQYTYNGQEHKPKVHVDELFLGVDYDITYTNNINCGTGRVVINGIGQCTGSVTLTFSILKQQLSDNFRRLIPNPSSMVYTGNKLEPIPTIAGLTLTTDFYVIYTNNIEVGTAVITAKGLNNYEGELECVFYITPADTGYIDINGFVITVDPDTMTYTGNSVCPSIYISGLTMGRDYVVSYSDNVNAGTAKAIVSGIGNYTGVATKTFTIEPKDLTGYDINVIPKEYPYTGEPIIPNYAISGLTKDKDYTVNCSDNINLGRATISATGINNYTGSIRAYYTIIQTDIITKNPKLEETSFVYTGEEIKPTVIINGLTLNVDYSVNYKNNIEAGKATALVTGIGNYCGECELDFYITAESLAKKSVTITPPVFVYSGEPCEPKIEVEGVEPSDYTVEFENNVNAGNATVIITGINNFSGQIFTQFKITPKPISDFEIEDIPDQYYCNQWLEPEVNVIGLQKRVDYTVTYRNNMKLADNAEAIVTGRGNYGGTASKFFRVISTPLSMVTGKYGKASAYTVYRIFGDPLILTFNGYRLQEGIDYKILSTNEEGKYDYILCTFEIEGLDGFTDVNTFRFRMIYFEPPAPDEEDDGVYGFEDIDTGTESAEGNYDFLDIDSDMNFYDGTWGEVPVQYEGMDPDDYPGVIVHHDSDPGSDSSDEDEDYGDLDDNADEEEDSSEDPPEFEWVIVDERDDPSKAEGDYDFDAMSGIYLDEYDEDDGHNLNPDGTPIDPGDVDDDDRIYNFGDIDEGDETAEGDYDFGDLDEGVDKDSVAEGDYDFNIEAEGFPVGQEFELDNTPIYANYCSTTSTDVKSGLYFIYKPEIMNDKVRITKTEAAIGHPARCTGWVKISDLRNLGKPKVGEAFMVTGKLMKYTNMQEADGNYFIEVFNKLMYVIDISNEATFPFPYAMAYGPQDTRVGWAALDIMERYYPDEQEQN